MHFPSEFENLYPERPETEVDGDWAYQNDDGEWVSMDDGNSSVNDIDYGGPENPEEDDLTYDCDEPDFPEEYDLTLENLRQRALFKRGDEVLWRSEAHVVIGRCWSLVRNRVEYDLYNNDTHLAARVSELDLSTSWI